MRRLALCLLVPLLAGCGDGRSESSGEDEFADGRGLVQELEPWRRPPRVDLILVVDDSPSFGVFSPRWAANLEAFAELLESEEVHADIRVAITTTSVPGPTCAGARARGGEPILDSCRAHLDDLVGPDEHGELGGGVQDHRAECEQACGFAEIPRRLSPGRDEHDLADLAIRPWIEAPHNPHGGNLDGISLAEALTCAGLQGHVGCEFESPIEAAARMVEQLGDPSHPLGEFRRPDAALMILFVSDEDDCSHPAGSATIFDPDGDRSFWPDPAASEPSSGICIAAGLTCDAEGCALTDHALDGSVTDDPASAVLTPPQRLHDALLAAGEYDEPAWVPYVASLGGFGPDGSLTYTSPVGGVPELSSAYFDAFGVALGCVAPSPDDGMPMQAAPGGRLAEVVTPGSLFSICEPDWSPVFGALTSKILPGPPPWCVTFECVADLAPDDPLIEPDCVFEEVDYAGARTAMPACERDADGWRVDPVTQGYVIPADADACWVYLNDPDQVTESTADNMAIECSEAGNIGETRVARRPGAYLPYDSHYELRCRPC